MVFMMFFIIPNFQKIFESNGINSPLMTTIIINISKFIRENHLVINILLIIFMVLLVYILKTSKKLKLNISELKFKIPIIKNINTLIITTRFSRIFGVLMQSGVQVIDSISISSKIIDNNYIFNKLAISNQYIRQGNKLSKSLDKPQVFPDLFISMISVGEESGKLDETLSMITTFYENDLDNKINQIMKLVEPIIIVIMGLFIGIFALSMVFPMFDSMIAI